MRVSLNGFWRDGLCLFPDHCTQASSTKVLLLKAGCKEDQVYRFCKYHHTADDEAAAAADDVLKQSVLLYLLRGRGGGGSMSSKSFSLLPLFVGPF